ncbi:DNA (cytosine-5-)-methyltransferase [Streptomyces sp. NBC_01210]|uniref:DNA (cytosine-5-)-methyltransferase n=1 Tax=Streptomyces sp. NBC_01210 TaxID=2903774 RepID=UPI002E0F1DEA|nr:DNA (cytosine-5-)-methyltransferase [Streptomyces sp. NBC_01210]
MECPEAKPLLKTPTAQLATNGGSQHPDKRRAGGHGPTLADEVEHLLPGGAHYGALPNAERLDAPSPEQKHSRTPNAGEDAWGPYAPAISRWERISGRAAPPATNERGRLATAFVEWMMGLAPGWVTAVPGLTRAAQLKALGNGVVPAQASGALRILLDRANVGSAGP